MAPDQLRVMNGFSHLYAIHIIYTKRFRTHDTMPVARRMHNLVCNMQSDRHAYIHTCMHICIHTYLHTYIHTCMHAYKNGLTDGLKRYIQCTSAT